MNLTMAKRRRQRATRNERKAQAWKTRWLSPTFGCNAEYFSFLVILVVFIYRKHNIRILSIFRLDSEFFFTIFFVRPRAIPTPIAPPIPGIFRVWNIKWHFDRKDNQRENLSKFSHALRNPSSWNPWITLMTVSSARSFPFCFGLPQGLRRKDHLALYIIITGTALFVVSGLPHTPVYKRFQPYHIKVVLLLLLLLLEKREPKHSDRTLLAQYPKVCI